MTKYHVYASQNTTSIRSQWIYSTHSPQSWDLHNAHSSVLIYTHVLYILIPKVYLEEKHIYIYFEKSVLLSPPLHVDVDSSRWKELIEHCLNQYMIGVFRLRFTCDLSHYHST